MKKCTSCGAAKPDTDFYVNRGKPTSACRDCLKQRSNNRYWANHEKAKAQKAEYYAKRAQYFKSKATEWREANRERDIEKSREWRLKNPERAKANIRAWAKNNQARRNHLNALRKEFIRQATPVWASRNYIALFYLIAGEESERQGVPFHVDHIVPVRSDTVCGLHNEFNLQVLSADENVRKGNRYWPDMP